MTRFLLWSYRMVFRFGLWFRDWYELEVHPIFTRRRGGDRSD